MAFVFRSKIQQRALEKSVELGHRVTQREISEGSGVSLPTVSRWFNNDMDRLEAESAWRFMQYFGRDLDDIVEIVEVKQ